LKKRGYSINLTPQRGEFLLILVIGRQAAQILATLSGCVALITVPQSSPATTIRHLHLVQVEPQRVMLILVTDTYETRSVFMDLPAHLGESDDAELLAQELQLLSNFLNHHLCGKVLSELSLIDWQELDRQFQKFAAFLQQLCQDLSQFNQSPTTNPILIGGVSEFLRQPEFSELAQAQTIIQMLEEEQNQLWPLIYEGLNVRVPFAPESCLRPPVLIHRFIREALRRSVVLAF
jgi:heat-inducible transcriptional repressor